MDDKDPEGYNPSSAWSGFFSLFAGIVGVLLVMTSVANEPKSLFGLIMGLLTFWLAFFLRLVHLIYKSPFH